MRRTHSGDRRLERLAWLLDSSIPIPGINFRIGLEGIVGLIPGVGDALGAVISTYILAEAARLGAPRSILLKMAFNVAADAVLGAVPFLGDLFDLTWKANLRNVRLLQSYLEKPGRTVAASRLFVLVLLLSILLFVGTLVVLGALLVRWLWLTVNGR